MADNLLDKASILLTPTAYDNGSMLSIKPNENLYGTELVTNGDFSNGSANWTLGTGMSIINEELHITNNSTNDRVYQNIGLVQGKIYQVSFDVLSFSGTSFQILMGGTSTPDIGVINSTGSYTFTQECLGSNGFFYFMSTLSNVVIDNVSVVEDLSGDFQFSRSSAATRVNAQGLVENVQIISSELVSNGDFSQIGTEEVLNGNFSQEGSELITNGDFSQGTQDWTFNTNGNNQWSVVNEKAVYNASLTDFIITNNVLTIGKKYLVSFDISDTNNSTIRLSVNSEAGGSFDDYTNGDGKYTKYITANTNYLRIGGSASGASFSIDNVSVKEVGQDWTLGTGWSIGEDKAISDGTTSNLDQFNTSIIGKSYKVSVTVSDITTGALSVRLGSTSGSEVINITSNGTYVAYGVAETTYLRLRSQSGFDGSVTNISVKEVGQDWTLDTGWSIGDDKVVATDVDSTSFDQLNILTAGKLYKITYTILDYVSGSVRFRANLVNGSTNSANGTYTDYIVSGGTKFSLQGLSNFNGSITNISVKEITDDTDIPRINYSGFSYQDSLGSELVVNGDFATDSNWNKGAGWSISGGKANSDGTNNFDQLRQTNILTIGKSYKLSFDLTYVSGLVKFTTPSVDSEYNSSGTYTLNFIADSANVVFTAWGAFTGSIDNVSVKEVTGQEVVPDSGCGSWLLEPQSTNLITESEALSTMQAQATITDNNLLSPTGDVNASLVVENTSTNNHGIRKAAIIPTNASAVDYTVSVFAKKKERQFVQFQFYADSTQYNSSTFNLNDGTTTGDSSTHKIEDYGNGWYRCSFTQSITQSTGSYNFAAAYMSQSLTSYYAGDGTSGIYMFGFQTEQQSYATSYIPTNGATNTRLQDIATNSGNATLINSTEGVLYAEISALADDGTNRIISLSENGNIGNRVNIFYTSGSNKVKFVVKVNNSNVFDDTITLSDIVAYNKVALKYKENDFAIWINGIKETEQLSGSTYSENTLDKLNFDQGSGSYPFYGKTKALAVFKEALTDAELQSLTTI